MEAPLIIEQHLSRPNKRAVLLIYCRLSEHYKRQDCLKTLGFNEDETLFVWKLLASILKIGNLEFVPKIISSTGTDSCSLANEYGKLNWKLSETDLPLWFSIEIFNGYYPCYE